jgi:hypothetical protein
VVAPAQKLAQDKVASFSLLEEDALSSPLHHTMLADHRESVPLNLI